MPDEPYAHIYPQQSYHDEAYIFGNRVALMKLRDALSALLDGRTTEVGRAQTMVFAGDAYHICIMLQTIENLGTKLTMPYTDKEFCPDGRDGLKDPIGVFHICANCNDPFSDHVLPDGPTEPSHCKPGCACKHWEPKGMPDAGMA